MRNCLEDFSRSELLQRRALQKMLHGVLQHLKVAIREKRFDDALFINIQGARILSLMERRDLTLADEQEMIDTLRENVTNILILQHRLQ